MISVFDMFKVGIGPSSSHTVGPMKAAKEFVDELENRKFLAKIDRLQVDVYGSLSLTGRGHNTDIAIIMGLMGYLPHNVDIERIEQTIADLKANRQLLVAENSEQSKKIRFDFFEDMIFHSDFLALHENGVKFTAFEGKNQLFENTYYSIGGGFIVDEANFGKAEQQSVAVPFPYKNAADLLAHCWENGLPLSSVVWKNELALHSKDEISAYLAKIWQTMQACIERGLYAEGLLPGPLKVARRAC